MLQEDEGKPLTMYRVVRFLRFKHPAAEFVIRRLCDWGYGAFIVTAVRTTSPTNRINLRIYHRNHKLNSL